MDAVYMNQYHDSYKKGQSLEQEVAQDVELYNQFINVMDDDPYPLAGVIGHGNSNTFQRVSYQQAGYNIDKLDREVENAWENNNVLTPLYYSKSKIDFEESNYDTYNKYMTDYYRGLQNR